MTLRLELFYPIKNPRLVTQGFGENQVPIYKTWGLKGHTGIDMVGTHGQIVRAAHDGIVTYAGTDKNEGWGIVIRTLDKKFYSPNPDVSNPPCFYKTIYWHLVQDSILVKVGDQVMCGQPIAQCGNTGVFAGQPIPPQGNAPTWAGTHLHFGLKPIAQGENDWTWTNYEQNNGYAGAIDPAPFWNGIYAEDYISFMDQIKIIAAKITELWKKVFV